MDADAPAGGDGTSWNTAFGDLQDALNLAAVAGGQVEQIWVAAGVYKPAEPMGDHFASFDLIDGVGLYGGFLGTSHPLGGETSLDERDPLVNETILSGDLNGDDAPDFWNRADNSISVLSAVVVGETGILDGFVISGGWNGSGGAGLYISGGAPTIRNCIFRDNRASYGSGIYSNISATTLENCTFSANYETAVWADDGLSVVTSCAFLENSGRAVVALNDADVVFTNCVWIGNAAGGLEADDATVINSLFSGNTAEDGAGVYVTRLVLRNCTFTGNMAEELGGAVLMRRGEVTNCTITQNVAGIRAGGIFHNGSRNFIVANSILWGNTDTRSSVEGAQLFSYGYVPVNYSNIQGLSGLLQGTGNIDADPRFLDVDGSDNTLGTVDDNVRLDQRSPCVDAGDNAAVPPDETDLDGDGDTIESIPMDIDGAPRFQDVPLTPDTGSGTSPMVDMGAYESPKQQFLIDVDSVAIPEGGTATFSVHLALEPVVPIDAVVVWYSGDNDISVALGPTLQFDASNYDTPRLVTLAAAEDTDYLDGSATIQIQASGMPTAELTATETDNEFVPPVLYVRADYPGGDGTSWSVALKELGQALDLATNSNGVSQIWVARGTYKPASQGQNPDAMFQLVSGVGVYGGFVGNETTLEERNPSRLVTILHGNGQRAVSGSGVDATAVLDGFTVTGGRSEGVSPSGRGGAMIIVNGSPTINNCKFEDNRATYIGGAVYIEVGDPVFTGCAFSDNWVPGLGGAIGAIGGSPQLRGCTFTGNYADTGAGGSFDGGTATMIDCVFSGNSAGEGGGIAAWDGDVTLINCLFVDNSASGWADGSHGGGAVFAGDATMINCTFSENTTWYGGAAVHVATGELTLFNSILWGDASNQLSVVGAWGWFGGTIDAHHSCIRTFSGVAWEGEGNIAVEPRLDYGARRFLRLAPGSPAIDAGDNDALPEYITTDLDGRERYGDGDADGIVTVDMGAYEFVMEPDCNQNDIFDEDEIADGSTSDCDGNGVPDECDVTDGSGSDCNGNAVPDDCDLTEGSSSDCNGNAVPDECDLAEGGSADCDGNQVPDECDSDFDGDGVIDNCDGCPLDPNKIEPGNCGCGVSETADEDGDGVVDCVDQCRGADDAVFAPECATAIPTVTTWGLVVLTLLLLAIGKVCFGGRRQEAQ